MSLTVSQRLELLVAQRRHLSGALSISSKLIADAKGEDDTVDMTVLEAPPKAETKPKPKATTDRPDSFHESFRRLAVRTGRRNFQVGDKLVRFAGSMKKVQSFKDWPKNATKVAYTVVEITSAGCVIKRA